MDMIDFVPAIHELYDIAEQMDRYGFGEGEDLSEYDDLFEELGIA